MPDMWHIILNALGGLYTIHFNYEAKEPGMGYYAICDPNEEDFKWHKYFVNVYGKKNSIGSNYLRSGKYDEQPLKNDNTSDMATLIALAEKQFNILSIDKIEKLDNRGHVIRS